MSPGLLDKRLSHIEDWCGQLGKMRSNVYTKNITMSPQMIQVIFQGLLIAKEAIRASGLKIEETDGHGYTVSLDDAVHLFDEMGSVLD